MLIHLTAMQTTIRPQKTEWQCQWLPVADRISSWQN